MLKEEKLFEERYKWVSRDIFHQSLLKKNCQTTKTFARKYCYTLILFFFSTNILQ